MPLPLEGILVVSVEQAVAAPHCTCHLAVDDLDCAALLD